MKNASATMYKIGRIFTFVLLGIAALLVLIYSILMIVGIVNGNFPAYLSNVIGNSIWLGIIIVVLIVAANSIRAIEEGTKETTPHILMIVFGAISGNVFYVLGGIFGLVALGQENNGQAQ